jgi:hypothetical protein
VAADDDQSVAFDPCVRRDVVCRIEGDAKRQVRGMTVAA